MADSMREAVEPGIKEMTIPQLRELIKMAEDAIASLQERGKRDLQRKTENDQK